MDNFDLDKGGVKFDAGKVRMDLVPADSIFAVACVFTYGAIKYADWNWAKGMRRGRIIAALDRHKTAYLLGEYFDRESNLPHTWHMGCCTHMLISADLRGVAIEDRVQCLDAYYKAQEYFAAVNPVSQIAEDDVPDSWTESTAPPPKKFLEMSEAQEDEFLRRIRQKEAESRKVWYEHNEGSQ